MIKRRIEKKWKSQQFHLSNTEDSISIYDVALFTNKPEYNMWKTYPLIFSNLLRTCKSLIPVLIYNAYAYLPFIKIVASFLYVKIILLEEKLIYR